MRCMYLVLLDNAKQISRKYMSDLKINQMRKECQFE